MCFVVLGRVHRGVAPQIPWGVRMPAGRRRRRPLVGVPRERGGRAGRRTRARGSARLISWGFRANHSVEKYICLNFTGLRKLGKMVPWIWSRAPRLLAVPNGDALTERRVPSPKHRLNNLGCDQSSHYSQHHGRRYHEIVIARWVDGVAWVKTLSCLLRQGRKHGV